MTSTGQASDIVFKGIDGNECEEFIATIEELSFAEGWSRDRERMLLFARSRLRNKALRWFARLDASKKNDWDSFVEALFDQYPPGETSEAGITTPVCPGASTVILPSDQVLNSQLNARDEGQIAENRTTHSPLPNHRAYNPSAPGRQFGILRLVGNEESAPPQYIWHGHRGLYHPGGNVLDEEQLRTTLDRQEALLVCFVQSTEPHTIGCLNTTCHLGDLSLSFQPCSTNSYGIRAAKGVTKPHGGFDARNVSMVWNVLEGGTVQATLSEFDPNSKDYTRRTYTKKEDFKTIEVHLDISGTSIWFVKPGTPLPQDSSNGSYVGRSMVNAHIVFEPL